MITVSRGYKNKLFTGHSWTSLFNSGCIELFSGAVPDVHAAPSGTLIARITQNGGGYTHGVATNGLTYTVSTEGLIEPAIGANWILTGIAAGTFTYGRIFGLTDTFLQSETDPRIQFDVNPADGWGLHTTNATPGVGAQFPCTSFLFGMPPIN